MPAPKRANTSAATAKAAEVARRRGQNTKAAALAEAGWICLPPEAYRDIVIRDNTAVGTVTVHCRACDQVVATHKVGGCHDRLDTLLADIINHRGKVTHYA